MSYNRIKQQSPIEPEPKLVLAFPTAFLNDAKPSEAPKYGSDCAPKEIVPAITRVRMDLFVMFVPIFKLIQHFVIQLLPSLNHFLNDQDN